MSVTQNTRRALGTGCISDLRLSYQMKQKQMKERGNAPAPPCPEFVWVCGDDKPYIFFCNESSRYGVVVVPREGAATGRLAEGKALCAGLRQIAEPVPESDGVSSSKLRRAMQSAFDSAFTTTSALEQGIRAAVARFMTPSAAALYASHIANEGSERGR